LRHILFGLAALILVGVGLIFVLPLFISTDDLQKKVLAQVESATGYRVRIDGPLRMTFFPSLDLVAHDVGIAQQPAAGGPDEFATARTLRFGLLLSGLLHGKVQFTEVALIDPVVMLPLPSRKESVAEMGQEGKPKDGDQRNLSLEALTIRNGTLVLPPSADGKPGRRITALDAEASLPAVNGPLAFDALADYDGDRVSASGSIGNFGHFLEGASVPVEVTLKAPSLPEGAMVTGAASYKDDTFTLAQFAAKSGPHALSGNATYRDDHLTIAQGRFDETPFAGRANMADDTLTVDANVAIEGKTVRVTGALSNFNQLFAGAEAPLTLVVDAPDYLPSETTLSGGVTYKDDTFALPKFTATSGDDAVSGAAAYKDDVLSLSQVEAKLGGQTIAGGATYQDGSVNLDVMVGADGKPTRITGSIAAFDKLLKGTPAPIKLVVDGPSLPAKTTVEGSAAYKDKTLVLDPVLAKTQDQILSGTATAKLGGNVPTIAANLTATSTGTAAKAAPPPAEAAQDTEKAPAGKTESAGPPPPNPMAPPSATTEIAVAPPAAKETPPKAQAPAAAAAQAGKPAPAPGTRTSGFGWRAEKLGVLALKDVNADVTLKLDGFVYEGIRIASATVRVALAGGKLSIDAPNLKAYGGGGSLTLVIDASGVAPAHRLKVSLVGLDAYPFLSDLADFRTLEGKSAVALDLTASGDSEHAMVSSLNGTAKFEFTDGALRGLNVANMLRNLTTGILTGWQFKQEAKTVFDKFGASFTIASGHAQTDDLRLTGPLVSVGGAGTVDIPAQRLKFRVNPFMLASVEGQGGKNSMLGFPVPIAVTGPWDNPAIYPDVAGVLENPVAAYKQLDKLGGGLIAMPANMLGIDTGKGGLVEKSVAVPTAITKGVVGGIGKVLGVTKKQEEAPPQTGDAAPAEANAKTPQPAAQAEPKQQAAPQKKLFDGIFGN
jgi:AsmA protein